MSYIQDLTAQIARQRKSFFSKITYLILNNDLTKQLSKEEDIIKLIDIRIVPTFVFKNVRAKEKGADHIEAFKSDLVVFSIYRYTDRCLISKKEKTGES